MRRMASRYVGEYYWTHGPLVLGSEAARKAIATALSEADRKKLVAAGKKKQPVVATKVAGHAVYVLPRADHTRVAAVDKKAAVLVRRNAYANPVLDLPRVMKYDLDWTSEPWKPQVQSLVVPPGGLVLFDAIAQHPDPVQKKDRGREWLRLGLPPGTYVVEYIKEQRFGRGSSVSLLYVHPKDHRPAIGGGATPGAPPPLVIDKPVAAAAKKLRFITSEGGPLLFLPERAAKQWWGVCNEEGESVFDKEPTHYDRACAVRGDAGTLKVDGATAVVLGTPDQTALHPLEDGVLLVRWVGADHAAGLLAAAVGPGVYKPLKPTLTSNGEPWLLFDSAQDGRSLGKKDFARITIPKGTYRVELMTEWDGDVSLGGKTSGVMATAVRLRRE
jgi:hypothetical protein